MESSIGKNLKITLFGGSHEPEIGVRISGLLAGFPIDESALCEFMARRAPGKTLTSGRSEADIPLLSSTETTADGFEIRIENTDFKPSDYEKYKTVPRPGHADYTSMLKYGEIFSGGGMFSGRMTAALTAAGGVCRQILESRGTLINAEIFSIGSLWASDYKSKSDFENAYMKEIAEIAAEGDSVGGTVLVTIKNPPQAVGGPLFDGLESILAPLFFAIPSVKGVEFGVGFAAAGLKGSENNDCYRAKNGTVVMESNMCGGILGGISTGTDIVARLAFKPTPSISKPQKSIDMKTMTDTEISVSGRHDPCIVLRACPIAEATAAIGLLDAMLEK